MYRGLSRTVPARRSSQPAAAARQGQGAAQALHESPRVVAQAARLQAATGLAPVAAEQPPVQAWSGRADQAAIEAERERLNPGSGVRRAARALFQEAEVVNFTSVEHQLFNKVKTNFAGLVEGAQWTGQPKDHVVNKWERAEQGEQELVDYDLANRGQAASKTLAAEARALRLAVKDYAALDAPKRMQFALLNYGQDMAFANGFGRSRFVIRRAKCQSDGFMHFGDSAVDAFRDMRGTYKEFGDVLLKNDEAAQALVGKTAPWIEVQFKGGIALPGDLDRFEVDQQELDTLAPFVPKDLAAQVGAQEAMEAALRSVFGDKLRLR